MLMHRDGMSAAVTSLGIRHEVRASHLAFPARCRRVALAELDALGLARHEVDRHPGTPMHLMQTVRRGRQRIRNGHRHCLDANILKQVTGEQACRSNSSANTLDIVASSTLLVRAVGLTASKKWFDQWWQTTGDPEETDGFD